MLIFLLLKSTQKVFFAINPLIVSNFGLIQNELPIKQEFFRQKLENKLIAVFSNVIMQEFINICINICKLFPIRRTEKACFSLFKL